MKFSGFVSFGIHFLLGATASLLAIERTNAGPREDTLAGAFRCAPVSHAGVWLDCYYGAAEPMRALLALPPAPSAQIALARKPPDDATPVEDTAERAQIMADAARCDHETSDRAWLNCYYASAQPIRSRLGLRVVPQLAPVSGSGRLAAAQSVHGVRFASYTFDMRGFFTVTLSNGQVWRQQSGDTEYARWNKRASDYAATISHSMFGDFNMRVTGSAKIYKVQRVS